jgi:putative hydrolase of the HAD superfamily
MKITNRCLRSYLWDFDKIQRYFEGIFQRNHPAIEIKTFIENMPINQACWKLYQYDKISHELRYNRLRHSLMRSIIRVWCANWDYCSGVYPTITDNNLLLTGAFEILDYLNENYKLHIITNGFAEVQGRKIKMLSCMIIFILSQTLIWLGLKAKPYYFWIRIRFG